MKKIIFTVVLLVFAICIPAGIWAQSRTPNSPNDFKIANSAHGGVKITQYLGTRQDLVIPETIDGMKVTEIDGTVFALRSALRANNYTDSINTDVVINSVVFPNSLIKIGGAAFFGQPLTSVSFPSSLQEIVALAFSHTKLTSVVIPNGVTGIGVQAFANSPITTIVIPPSLSNYKASGSPKVGFGGAFVNKFDSFTEDVNHNINITKVTLPANVHDMNLKAGFHNDLFTAYIGNGKKAATYVWTGRIWSTAANAVPAGQQWINSINAKTLYDNAYAAYVKDDYDSAIRDFTQVIQLDPNNKNAFYHRARAYEEKGDYDRAIVDYSQAIRLDPNDSSAFNFRASAYMEKGDYDLAIADYNQLIKLDPRSYHYTYRAYAYYEKGDFIQARADVNMTLKVSDYHGAKTLSEELKKKGY